MNRVFIMGALALLAVGSHRCEAEVTVSRIDYQGWHDSYRMTNGAVELVFVPQIGRIMRYGYVDGENVLWNNDTLLGITTDHSKPVTEWMNYGGDKLWPAPQSKWGWPPDPALDGSPQSVQIVANSRLRVTSPASRKSGIVFSREISMAGSGSTVTIVNTMRNSGEKPIEWGIWEVTQANDPASLRAATNPHSRYRDGVFVFKDNPPMKGAITVQRGGVQFRRNPNKPAKIGVDSLHPQITAQFAGAEFRIYSQYLSGGSYPDTGCTMEAYSNPDPLRYMEMEAMAPVKSLKPGQATTLTTTWQLSRNSAEPLP